MQRRRRGAAPERRLCAVAVAISPGPAEHVAQRTPIGRATASLLPLPLDTGGGGVRAERLAEIRARKRLAVASEDYRLA
jgi:hypothetical protein